MISDFIHNIFKNRLNHDEEISAPSGIIKDAVKSLLRYKDI